jgi:septum formation protein
MTEKSVLVLGSSSPRRAELLLNIGITPNLILSPNVDEVAKKLEDPRLYVKRIALSKAQETLNLCIKNHTNLKNYFILTADTIVVKSKKILQKPMDENDARQMIKSLSGRRHYVLSAFVVNKIEDAKIVKSSVKVVKTSLSVKLLSDSEINWYISTNQWQGKSGSYGIQGAFEGFVKQISGSISNIIGLPLFNVNNVLLGMGFKK